MSLFQSREWWGHKPDTPTECSAHSLIVAPLDPALPPIPPSTQSPSLICSITYSGILRVFHPVSRDYSIEHLLLEHQFDEPCLQIESGYFTSSTRVAIAVLFSKKLSVYLLNSIGRVGTTVSYYELSHCYTHRFNHHAHSFIAGKFGSSDKESLCVLTLDSQLHFYRQDHYNFTRTLPSNHIIPIAMTYYQKNDSIVLANAEKSLESYKYTVLGETEEKKGFGLLIEKEEKMNTPSDLTNKNNSVFQEEKSLQSVKKLRSEWNVCIGEFIIELKYLQYFPADQCNNTLQLAILTPHSLIILNNDGIIQSHLHFDYTAISIHTYRLGDIDNIIIGAEENALFVYNYKRLLWATRINHTPMCITTGNFNNITNFIITGTDTAELLISYLGTDTPITLFNSKSQDSPSEYETMDIEHRKLLKIIKQAHNDKLIEPKEKLITKINYLNIKYQDEYDEYNLYCKQPEENNGIIIIPIQFSIQHNATSPISDVTISLGLPVGFTTMQPTINFTEIQPSPSPPVLHTINIYSYNNIIPCNLSFDVNVTYKSPQGENRVNCLNNNKFPLLSIVKLITPVKNIGHIITIDSNKIPPPSLNELFADICQNSQLYNNSSELQSMSNNILSFNFFADPSVDVTILVAKKTGRFRIQSNQLQAMNVILQELIERLNSYPNNTTSLNNPPTNKLKLNNPIHDPIKIGFSEDLPLNELFLLIDKHFSDRLNSYRSTQTLERYALMLRTVEKRLLGRFKDKNSAPIGNLELLLSESYNDIQTEIDKLQTIQNDHYSTTKQLSSVILLIINLISLKYNCYDKNTINLLKSIFHVNVSHGSSNIADNSNIIVNSGETGWEENVEMALIYVLKNQLSRTSQQIPQKEDKLNNNNSVAITQTEPLTNTTKLKKHINILIERLNKGYKLIQKSIEEPKSSTPTATTATTQLNNLATNTKITGEIKSSSSNRSFHNTTTAMTTRAGGAMTTRAGGEELTIVHES